MDVELLVIGGGPAAHAAALAYRDGGGTGAVLLVSEDSIAPYLRPPLSKDFLRGESEAGGLTLAPESAYTERGITLLLRRSVTDLDARERVALLDTGERVTYRACVLATGSAPRPLPVPGAGHARMLRSLDDAKALRSRATEARTAVVVGSGFIGCEAAASLARRGLAVRQVSREELPQGARLGEDVGRRIRGWLEEDGVTVLGGAEVREITPDGVQVGDAFLPADLVLVAAGVDPRSTLARQAGARVERERVVVDEHMRASLPGLLAAGDVALAHNASAGRRLVVEHWGEAETMGGVAGAVAAGGDAVWDAVPGFWTDIGERTLKYAAWGDGYADVRIDDHRGGAFTAWYTDDAGRLVGVATHDADEDYERADDLVRRSAVPPTTPARAATGS